MILVIFGAGASYDSVPTYPPSKHPRSNLRTRPPLASELFLEGEVFTPSVARFPECHPIIPYLQMASQEASVEQVLETLRAESESDEVRQKQLAAIKYLLHFMIWEYERHWRDVAAGRTNYVTLLDQLRRSSFKIDPVCLVTFNYDRMIEAALETQGIAINALSDYVKENEFRLFKLHGSTHWGREVDGYDTDIENFNAWQIGQDLVQRVGEIEVSNRFRIIDGHPIGKAGETPVFPAIALPVDSKRSFESPEDHIEILQGLLPQVTAMIVIGWAAAEPHFLDLLETVTLGRIPVCVVSGSKPSANAVMERIDAAVPFTEAHLFEGGFTEFVVSREAERFLRS